MMAKMKRTSEVERKTKETEINIKLDISGTGNHEISSGIPFFDHMLSLFAVHGFFDVSIFAKGDIQVDFHHIIESIFKAFGGALDQATSFDERITNVRSTKGSL